MPVQQFDLDAHLADVDERLPFPALTVADLPDVHERLVRTTRQRATMLAAASLVERVHGTVHLHRAQDIADAAITELVAEIVTAARRPLPPLKELDRFDLARALAANLTMRCREYAAQRDGKR